MKIHEADAKSLLVAQGLPVPPFIDTRFIWADASNIDSPEVVAVLYQ